MKFFECCIKCKPPKRYPGCSANCPDYKKDRAKFDEYKAQEKLRADLDKYYKKYPNNF